MIRRTHIFALAAAVLLAAPGCAHLPAPAIPPAPVAIADRTVLDEQALLALELAYKAARLAGETLVDAGLIRGETALRIGKLDRATFAALGVARGAYRAGNAASYEAALLESRTSIAALLALAGKD